MSEDPQIPKEPPFIKRHPKLLIILSLILILAGVGQYYLKQSTKKVAPSTSSIFDNIAPEEVSDSSGPAALVNGFEISRAAYQNSVKEISQARSRQGLNASDSSIASEIRQQAIAILINTQLLIQSSTASGITVTDEEVEIEYTIIEKDWEGAETLALALGDLNMTEEDLRDDIREKISIDKHIDQETNYREIVVTDEEITAYYENIKATNAEIPSLESKMEELRKELTVQKQQQAITNFIQKLKDSAEIEVLL